MLTLLYTPVSFLLATCHDLTAALSGPDSALGWALAVAALVVVVRLVLLAPAVASMRAGRALSRLQPELAVLRRRHREDPVALAAATRDLQQTHGVRPFALIGPMLLQLPIMLGAVGVLHGFVPGAASNGVLDAGQVRSFLTTGLGRTVLGGEAQGLAILEHGVFSPSVLLVAAPLAIVAAIVMHLTARLARRRATTPTEGPAGAIALWLLPTGTLLGGLVLPAVMLVYVLTHSLWTLAQQYLVGRVLDAREAAVDHPGPSA